jgi:hypothetical protein
MGHSEYDPVAEERRPWNAGRKLGAKRALKPQQRGPPRVLEHRNSSVPGLERTEPS